MNDEKPVRKPGGLDLADFAPSPPKDKLKPTAKKAKAAKSGVGAKSVVADDLKLAAVKSASEAGFTSRTPGGGSIDGRSLRRTGRDVQMNIKVSEETKRRFWAVAVQSENQAAGAILEMLLDHYEKSE